MNGLHLYEFTVQTEVIMIDHRVNSGIALSRYYRSGSRRPDVPIIRLWINEFDCDLDSKSSVYTPTISHDNTQYTPHVIHTHTSVEIIIVPFHTRLARRNNGNTYCCVKTYSVISYTYDATSGAFRSREIVSWWFA